MNESPDSSALKVCASRLSFPEGGPARTAEGGLCFVELMRGQISVWAPGDEQVRQVANVGGGPNSVVIAPPQSPLKGWVFTQNGGVAGTWRSPEPCQPSIQAVDPAGGELVTVAERVDGHDLAAPNDLCFAPDGILYFTDPAEPYRPEQPTTEGRIHFLRPDGDEGTIKVGRTFPNGIAWFDRLLWTESYTNRVMALGGDGVPEVVAQLPEGHVPDGFDVGDDGTIYVTTTASGGVVLISPGGDLSYIHLDNEAYTTNCLQVPGEGLYVTDAADPFSDQPCGRLWLIEDSGIRSLAERMS